jgi:hypothetical protein
MKLFSIATLLALSVLLTACDSLTNPFASWFHGHGDSRVYNPQTGQWEYPNGNAPASSSGPKRSAAVAGAMASTPAPQQTSDGRMFDPQKNQWVEMHNANSPGSDSPPASPSANPTPSALPPPPQPPRPQRDTGVYNPVTGKIEWQSSGGTTPSYAAVVKPTPKPKANTSKVKHWWWPF